MYAAHTQIYRQFKSLGRPESLPEREAVYKHEQTVTRGREAKSAGDALVRRRFCRSFCNDTRPVQGAAPLETERSQTVELSLLTYKNPATLDRIEPEPVAYKCFGIVKNFIHYTASLKLTAMMMI